MNLKDIVGRFTAARILVVGDIVLDRFIRGDAQRISPEAPVPVVTVKDETYCLGGAGNVANNITALGGSALVAGIVGRDYTSEVLSREFASRNIDTSGVISDAGRMTSIKTRIIAGHQQVVRFDRETVGDISRASVRRLLDFVMDRLQTIDAILISDYGKGVVTRDLILQLIRIAKKHGKIITVDPKIEHFSRYKSVDCLTPNLNEAKAGMGVSKITDENDIDLLGKRILEKLKCKSVLITRGEAGMTLYRPEGKVHIPTVAREVFDVSGAGDTVIAAFTLALASGAQIPDACRLSNYAAGIVVGKLGTATVSPRELLNAVRNS
jgi:D-beta-D-heptose 7-phosphate kinase/D-beta-D-heptose 1-phosphate adenosyltransferase